MIEIIADCLEDAKRIQACGADRIELVSALSEGGLTPSYGTVKNVVNGVNIPVNVMIRPHSRSFLYSREDIGIMKEDIKTVRAVGANGVVLGVLDGRGEIFRDYLEELLEACSGLYVTFHKAIDELFDPVEGVKILSKYPQIKTVLTSGGKRSISENISVINEMRSNSGHINVMAGGGLNFENIEEIIQRTGLKDYHFGTVVRDNGSPSGYINEERLKRLVKIIRDNAGEACSRVQ